jgi:membrane protein DedA with SNARE-associated domain
MTEYLPQINVFLDNLFSYGAIWVYLIILLACLIENLFPPFPGDLFIVASGGLVALDRLDPAVAMAAVCAGGMTSVMLLYAIGRNYGRNFFMKRNLRIVTPTDITHAEVRFARWGGLILLASRFVVGIRVVLAVVAGMAVYPVKRMFFYTLASYLIFSGLLMYLGFKMVSNLDRLEYLFRTYNYVVWPIIVALVGLYLFRHLKPSRKGNQK